MYLIKYYGIRYPRKNPKGWLFNNFILGSKELNLYETAHFMQIGTLIDQITMLKFILIKMIHHDDKDYNPKQYAPILYLPIKYGPILNHIES